MSTILAVYFVWHPADEKQVRPLVDYVFERFQRDTNHPFSRSMNLPVFFRTSSNKNKIPKIIESTAEKNIIFCFSSLNVTGDDKWIEYYNTFQNGDNYVVPVALNPKYGLNLGSKYNRTNYMRLYDFTKDFLSPIFFISVAHEVIRFCFRSDTTSIGDKTALKLFISHAKNDLWAVKLAKSIKDFIDNTSMHRFFDVHDIHIAHDFHQEIEGNVKESTLIAIQSDSYSSRYWCQKEVLIAKENQQPMIVVNHLKYNEDRIFPHTVNIPSLRVASNNTPKRKDKYRVLEMALLETLRYNYHKQLLTSLKLNSKTLVIPRPPELSDITQLFSNNNGKINKLFDEILYPDPPVYNNELKFLESLSVKAVTPLTRDEVNLKNASIGISISNPEKEEVLSIGHNENHLINLSQNIARHLLFRNGTLIYGGDLRKNGFTEYLLEEAKIVQDRLQEGNFHLKNYIAWPIYKADNDNVLKWKSKYNKIAEMIEVSPHKNIAHPETFLLPNSTDNCLAWSLCLTKMRKEMIAACDIRICAGGKLSGYKGKYPGGLEEIDIAIANNKPIYLVGGFGGVSSRVCGLLMDSSTPEELTLDWQIKHNSGYNELINKISETPDCTDINYKAIVKKIQNLGLEGISQNNGLTPEENIKLFKTQFAEEVILLILKGIENLN